MVDFPDPVFTGVSEIVVTGPGSPAITSVDDLAGKDVFVRKLAYSLAQGESLGRQEAKRRVTPPRTR